MLKIHTMCRKNVHPSNELSLIDVNLNVENLSCGLFDFNLDFLKTVNFKNLLIKKLFEIINFTGNINRNYLSCHHHSV